jgi:hypothetical protein
LEGASGITILGLLEDVGVLVLFGVIWLLVTLLMRVFMVVGAGKRNR